MDNPGVFTLAQVDVTVALSGANQTPIVNLDGMSAATIQAILAYGSGGTSLSALVQTSLDGGVAWLDVARFDFTTASRRAWCNLSGLSAKGVAAYAALAAEGVTDGLLGNRLRAVISSVGVYASTTLLITAGVR